MTTLTFYFHPLSSFCHKVLIALYENGAPFTPEMVNLADRQASARFFELWPIGKIPLLHDARGDRAVPETSLMIHYLDAYYPGARPLVPADTQARLDAMFWDRFFDLYVHQPMQKFVTDRLRPENARDPHGVGEARLTLMTAYSMIEKHMADKTWAIGDEFTIADCAAAPPLFYADFIVPFSGTYPNMAAYRARLMARPSYQRALAEARPFFRYFPYAEAMPAHLREG